MNCEKLRKLFENANEMAANNIWEEKAYVVNKKIWDADNYNFVTCTRLARYYRLNGNIPDAEKMYLKALEIYPNDYVVKMNLYEIEKLHKETKFMDELTTSRECHESGRKLTQKGHYWLARACYLKAYHIDPLLKYGVSLAINYSKLGEHDKIKKLYKELMDNNTSLDVIEDIKFGFKGLLKDRHYIGFIKEILQG